MRDQFLRRRLSVGTGDRNQPRGKTVSMKMGKGPEGLSSLLDLQNRKAGCNRRRNLLDQKGPGALLNGLWNKLVPVVAFAPDRHKQAPRLKRP